MHRQLNQIGLVALVCLGLYGCQTQPMTGSSFNTNGMSCLDNEFALDAIQHQVAVLVTQRIQQEKHTFALSRVAPLTMSLLNQGGSGQLIHSSYLSGFSAQQQTQLVSLIERHRQLLMTAKSNQCGFIPLAESQLSRTGGVSE